tara:strand:- start:2007 stop:2372 length:366 start_codon:yes stop_codon:yes gene_type:complete
MSSFTRSLMVTYLPEINMFRVERAFVYKVGFEFSNESVVVPEGFLTDFASVPWWAQWLISKTGKYNQAAVLHDYMYDKLSWRYTKERADFIFYEAMKVLNVPVWRRELMFLGVQIGGKGRW